MLLSTRVEESLPVKAGFFNTRLLAGIDPLIF
jgi:hypothetical protein